MLLRHKDYYREKGESIGWEWVAAGDYPYTHIFQKGDYNEGFTVIECGEQCLENGDLEFYAKNGMTCSKKRLKTLSKEFIKKLKQKGEKK